MITEIQRIIDVSLDTDYLHDNQASTLKDWLSWQASLVASNPEPSSVTDIHHSEALSIYRAIFEPYLWGTELREVQKLENLIQEIHRNGPRKLTHTFRLRKPAAEEKTEDEVVEVEGKGKGRAKQEVQKVVKHEVKREVKQEEEQEVKQEEEQEVK